MTVGVDPRFSAPRTLFFGIGAQKSGTSWLDGCLRDHPEVSMPVHKEQHYWTALRLPGAPDRRPRVAAELLRIEQTGVFRRLTRRSDRRAADRAWTLTDAMLRRPGAPHAAYADVMFQTWRGEPVVGEITPAYALLDADGFVEMAALAADVRFVFILRDPVARLISGARQSAIKRRAREGVLDESADARLCASLRDDRDPDFLKSRYDLTINRLESSVPADRICYVFFETMFRQSEFDRLAAFLGIARRPARFDRKVNASPVEAEPIAGRTVDAARAALEPVYAYVRGRFGSDVPAAWMMDGPHGQQVGTVARAAGSGRF